MSPEQCDGEDLDCRSDIFGLGATLCLALTGRPPFDGDTTASVMNRIVNEPLRLPTPRDGELSDSLCRVLEKMMAKDPGDRYQTPADALHALEEVERDLASPTPVPDAGNAPHDDSADGASGRPWSRLAVVTAAVLLAALAALLAFGILARL